MAAIGMPLPPEHMRDQGVLDLNRAVENVLRVCVLVGRLDQLDLLAAQVMLPLSPSDAGRLFVAANDAVDERGAPLLYDLVRLLDARSQRAFADTRPADVFDV